MPIKYPLRLTPQYRYYIWGGARLRPGTSLTAELWAIHEDNTIQNGAFAGHALKTLVQQHPLALLGDVPLARFGARFPVLIKLLDCADWLSVQVHPDDAQVQQLEGVGENGKTEAWFIVDAKPDAQLVAGLKPGVTSAQFASAVMGGEVTPLLQFCPVQTGDVVFMPAGMLHALGPGLLVYEVQQTSDWTYRVYDWGRPETEKRRMHREKSIQVTRPEMTANITPQPQGRAPLPLIDCPYFNLELITGVELPIKLVTDQSFHALTVADGSADVETSAEVLHLNRFDSVLLSADLGEYTLTPATAQTRLLLASVR